ncbi:hypothetical protein BDR06DRAFT_1010317 [Suillus hirtellus]|nr:hypothetical protein BDR06DRAFT_1010317 [Suillus hirtellus]
MTVRFKIELVCDVTNKLGYANAKAAINRIAQARKVIVCANLNGQDAVTGRNSFAMFPSWSVLITETKHVLGHSRNHEAGKPDYFAEQGRLAQGSPGSCASKTIPAFVRGLDICATEYNINAVNEYIVKRTLIATNF